MQCDSLDFVMCDMQKKEKKSLEKIVPEYIKCRVYNHDFMAVDNVEVFWKLKGSKNLILYKKGYRKRLFIRRNPFLDLNYVIKTQIMIYRFGFAVKITPLQLGYLTLHEIPIKVKCMEKWNIHEFHSDFVEI